MRPETGTYPEYMETYISKVKENDPHDALKNNTSRFFDFLEKIPENKGDHAYAEGKWTVKQLLIHIADAERIFAYRALRFARGDQQKPLPFDENAYAEKSNAGDRSLRSVINELKTVRMATNSLFESFGEEELALTGPTSMGTITVNALAFIICGHASHHMSVARERYL